MDPLSMPQGKGQLLTDAAQALLPNTHQHGVAEVAVSGLLEMLQGPGMSAIPLGALQGVVKVRCGACRRCFFSMFSSHTWKITYSDSLTNS